MRRSRSFVGQTLGSIIGEIAAANGLKVRIGRDKATMEFPLALGRPDLFPDVPVKLTDWKAEIIARDYIIEEISHTTDGAGGLTSKLKLEAKS